MGFSVMVQPFMNLKEEKVIYKNHFEMDRVLELMDFLKQFDLMESISLNGQSYANKKEMEILII